MVIIAIDQGQRRHCHRTGEIERTAQLLGIEGGDMRTRIRGGPASQPHRGGIATDEGERLRHLHQAPHAIAIEAGQTGAVTGDLHGVSRVGRCHGVAHSLGIGGLVDGDAIIQRGVTKISGHSQRSG